MKFSIITPSFNQGRFIADCIDSVSSQSGAEFEHIVIDACSTDETPDVLAKYPHLQWTSEPDNGMSDGINKGFLRARGDWLMWLNCDDFLLPGALAKVAAWAGRHPEADIVHGDCVFVNEDRTEIRRKYDTSVDVWDFLFLGCCIPSTATFYRASIIRAGHLLDVKYRNAMDLEFYLRLARAGFRFSYIPEVLSGFRLHEQSTTERHRERMIEEGLKCQFEHIEKQQLPNALKSFIIQHGLRSLLLFRRVLKRMMTHQRIR